jgi:hypothetical protein
MSEAEFDRVRGDLAIIQRAMALRLSFGKEMVVFGILLTAAAGMAALVSLWSESDWGQVGPFAAIMMLCVLWLYHQSRRVENLSHEIKLQVSLSITIYAALVGAALGYSSAAVLGPTIGAARTVGLYAASVGYVMVFLSILVLNALKSQERYYCLGLAAALLLAGLLIPIADRRYSFFLAHCFMAVGSLTAAIVQGAQLRTAESHHGAD